MSSPLYFYSSCQHKIKGYQSGSLKIVPVEFESPEIQGTCAAIACHKLKQAIEWADQHGDGAKYPCFVEDSGLYIDQLQGMPSPYVKQFCGTIAQLADTISSPCTIRLCVALKMSAQAPIRVLTVDIKAQFKACHQNPDPQHDCYGYDGCVYIEGRPICDIKDWNIRQSMINLIKDCLE